MQLSAQTFNQPMSIKEDIHPLPCFAKGVGLLTYFLALSVVGAALLSVPTSTKAGCSSLMRALLDAVLSDRLTAI